MDVADAKKIVLETFPEAYSATGPACGFLVIGDGPNQDAAWIDVATKLNQTMESARERASEYAIRLAELEERLRFVDLQNAIVRESLTNTIIGMLKENDHE